jgi:hypothetical protein
MDEASLWKIHPAILREQTLTHYPSDSLPDAYTALYTLINDRRGSRSSNAMLGGVIWGQVAENTEHPYPSRSLFKWSDPPFLPPGAPKWMITPLRWAYDRMNASPKFVAELKKRKLRLIASTGEEVQAVVAKALKDTSPAVVARARKIIFGGAS